MNNLRKKPGTKHLMQSDKKVPSCPPRKNESLGYVDGHNWAIKKNLTHKQLQCPKCDLWHIWKQRPKKGIKP